MTTLLWSSPTMLGRSSSPLNPNPRSDRSSSPLTSPTPFASSSRGHAFQIGSPHLAEAMHMHNGSPSLKHRHSQPYEYRHRPIPTRYTRPTAAKRHSSPAGDLFTEGTTPTEGAMWREKFSRRIEERERRKRAREDDLDRRRRGGRSEESMSEEEADRRAQEDDEEIFRRLMVLRRRQAQHLQLVSHELETGGSDLLLPDFWEDELSTIQGEERRLAALLEDPRDHLTRQRRAAPIHHDSPREDEEDEMWALEAAQAEQAERDTEEEELAKRVEEAYGVEVTTPRKQTSNQAMDLDLDIDWDAMDAMDEADGMDIED